MEEIGVVGVDRVWGEWEEGTGVEWEKAESTERVVNVELDLSTLRCWEDASSPSPVYMSASMPLSEILCKISLYIYLLQS